MADSANTTPAPADDLGGLKTIGDADLLEWDRQRQAWLDSTAGLDDDERDRRVDISDEWEDLILVAPCNTPTAVRLKVEVLQRIVKEGDRDGMAVAPCDVAEQVLAYLRGL